jgi:hypothetical protein
MATIINTEELTIALCTNVFLRRWPVGYWYLTIPLGALLFIYHFVTSIAEYVNKKKDADLEAEIQAGEELIEDSIFLQKIRDVETATDDEEERY